MIRVSLIWIFLFSAASVAVGQEFVQNLGQWDERILFRAQWGNRLILLEKDGFTTVITDPVVHDVMTAYHQPERKEKVRHPEFLRGHVIKTRFAGAQMPEVHMSDQKEYYHNYFLGNDATRWRGGVPLFGRVLLHDIYPGISVEFFFYNGQFKYDIIVQPEADLSQIKIAYEGADAVHHFNRKLAIATSVQNLIEAIPEAYQMVNEKKRPVTVDYEMKGDVVGFKAENYDRSKYLVIDPILIFATYSGSTADNFGFTATYDSKGNLYAGGNVTYPTNIFLPSGRYPATLGAFQIAISPQLSTSGPYDHFPCDVAISKYDSSGQNLIWATYLGGGDNEYPHSLVVDDDDRLIVMGSTFSSNFPMPRGGFIDGYQGGGDIYILRFNDSASAILNGTYMGSDNLDGITDNQNSSLLVHNFADDFRGDVYVDDRARIWVASVTKSDSFPIKNAFQPQKGARSEGVLFALNSSFDTLIFSSFIGGSSHDALYSVKQDRDGNMVASGGTQSTNLATTPLAAQRNFGGVVDGFIMKLKSDDYSLMALTYLGTPQYDQTYFVDIDKRNNIFVTGQTAGMFPKSPGTYGQQGRTQFIAKFNPTLSNMLLSTTFGQAVGNEPISPTAFLVDFCDNIYVSGWGATNGLPVTPDAIQSQTDNEDFYILVLDRDMQNLYYASYFGGSRTFDHVDGGTSRFDKRGVIYQAMCASCPNSGNPANITDIQTSPGAVFPTNLSPRCSNVGLKIDFQINYSVEAAFTPNPVVGCRPLTVTFTNRSRGTDFFWEFGDGNTSTQRDPVHTYQQSGVFLVKLIIRDSTACNLTDTASRLINVLAAAKPDFEFDVDPCDGKVTFKNQSEPANSYLWIFGDGKTSTDANPVHFYNSVGIYNVKLITNPGRPCADTAEKTVDMTAFKAENLWLPNVITPGVDNLNDCFRARGLNPVCDEVRVEIVNRWGNKVYESSNANFCWTGHDLASGQLVSAGTYFFVLKWKRNGEAQPEVTGVVTVIYP